MKTDTGKEQSPRILVINPGSTSTKVAVFSGKETVCSRTLEHSSIDLSLCKRVVEQIGFRKKAIDAFLRENDLEDKALDAIAGRGGLLRPLKGGTYVITDMMYEDLRAARYGEHASNLGALLARQFGDFYGVPSFVVNPVTLDEFDEPSRVTGVPGIERRSRIHALNIKSVAMRCARELGIDIGSTRFVIAHIGGGISICAMIGGRIIDSTDGLLGEGPFSVERAGTVPLAGMIELCFDRGLSKEEVIALLSKKSGFRGFFGVERLPEIYEMVDAGNHQVEVVLNAMIRQIAKWIGGMVALLATRPDVIILTGGMVNSSRLVKAVTNHVNHLGAIRLYPGEHEMEALAEGVIRVLNKEEEAQGY